MPDPHWAVVDAERIRRLEAELAKAQEALRLIEETAIADATYPQEELDTIRELARAALPDDPGAEGEAWDAGETVWRAEEER
jgi:hypothetical protein